MLFDPPFMGYNAEQLPSQFFLARHLITRAFGNLKHDVRTLHRKGAQSYFLRAL